MPLKDLTGQRFGRLTVEHRSGNAKHGQQAKWLCRCDCGEYSTCYGANLRKGTSTSCGCKVVEHLHRINFKHGHGAGNKTPEYRSWMAMKHRCLRKDDVAYHRYGGRGIKVCDRWLNSFENFLSDMGPRPNGKCLGRIDGNGDYTPENCQWETWEQQNDPSKKPYHTWLLRQRLYCQHPACFDKLTHATRVVNLNGRDETWCDEHASRLTHVRKSERKQNETVY